MHEFIPFTSDAEVEAIGHGLIDRTLPKCTWTHAAHFAATLWLLSTRPAVEVWRELPGFIRAYNEATGTANTDSSGYHETITRASLSAAHAFLRSSPPRPLYETCNALMDSALGKSDWLLQYWSRSRLFSVEARRTWLEPDLLAFPYEIPRQVG